MFGERVGQAVCHHGIAVIIALRRGEEPGQDGIRLRAVEIVGIDNRKAALKGLPGTPDSMSGTPGLLPRRRTNKGGGQIIQALADVVGLHPALQLTGKMLPQRLLELFTDNENHLIKTGAPGVKNRVVQHKFALGAYRVHLFNAAITAAHAGGQDQKTGGAHEDSFILLNNCRENIM